MWYDFVLGFGGLGHNYSVIAHLTDWIAGTKLKGKMELDLGFLYS